jgi:hypothetical protein
VWILRRPTLRGRRLRPSRRRVRARVDRLGVRRHAVRSRRGDTAEPGEPLRGHEARVGDGDARARWRVRPDQRRSGAAPRPAGDPVGPGPGVRVFRGEHRRVAERIVIDDGFCARYGVSWTPCCYYCARRPPRIYRVLTTVMKGRSRRSSVSENGIHPGGLGSASKRP